MKNIILTIGFFVMSVLSQTVQADDRILDIQSHTSPAGIEFWHVEDRTLPILTMHFAFRGAGSLNDPDDMIGLGQLISNTMDEGAADRDSQAFQKALEDHAIDLSFNSTRDHFTGKIKTIKRHADLAFELLRDAVQQPRFDEEAINRMRNANISRIKSSQARANWMASRLMNDAYYGDHPYARNSGGTISGLEAVTAEAMRDFVKSKFGRNNLVLATAGDMSADEAAAIIDQVFSKLPQNSDLKDISAVSPPAQPLQKAYKMDSPQSVVQMAWPAFAKTDDDYHALRVLNHILGGGGFSSLLMDEVREQQGLTYGIYSHPVHMDYADYMVIESATAPESVAPMVQSVQDILTRLTQDNVTDQQLSEAKSYLIGSLPLRFSSTLSLSGAALRMQLDGREITALDDFASHINAVTAEDVKRVAGRIFRNINPTVKIVTGAVPANIDYDMVQSIPGIE
mgnify:CR=1 FL=1